jgi:hypothetical protein
VGVICPQKQHCLHLSAQLESGTYMLSQQQIDVIFLGHPIETVLEFLNHLTIEEKHIRKEWLFPAIKDIFTFYKIFCKEVHNKEPETTSMNLKRYIARLFYDGNTIPFIQSKFGKDKHLVAIGIIGLDNIKKIYREQE